MQFLLSSSQRRLFCSLSSNVQKHGKLLSRQTVYAIAKLLNSITHAFSYYINSIGQVLLCKYNLHLAILYICQDLHTILSSCLVPNEADINVWVSYAFSDVSSLILLQRIIIFDNRGIKMIRVYML